VIRALLVPALMRLFGDWNWWMPSFAAKALFVREPRSPEQPALDSA
jgi:RND superfamily putative drug exporter